MNIFRYNTHKIERIGFKRFGTEQYSYFCHHVVSVQSLLCINRKRMSLYLNCKRDAEVKFAIEFLLTQSLGYILIFYFHWTKYDAYRNFWVIYENLSTEYAVWDAIYFT